MSKIRVAINGFGRIGRAFFKLALENKELEIVAINDLGEPANLVYLLKHDSAYGRYDKPVFISGKNLSVNGSEIILLSEADPGKLPWGDLDIDVVVESTGVFASYEKSKPHLNAGAKKVVITAPVKDNPEDAGISGATVLVGVNEDKLKTCQISSNASCTTNAGSPVLQILEESIGIEKAFLNTVHGYTASQSLVDGPNKKIRRGRAAAQNIVPTTTGAAIATAKAIESLKDKFDGISLRVPVVVGSIIDITFIAKRDTDADEVNNIFKEAAESDRWKGILSIAEDEIVSSDIIGDLHASIIDPSFTKVVGGNLVKVLSWYDNEYGYANTLVRHVINTGKNVRS